MRRRFGPVRQIKPLKCGVENGKEREAEDIRERSEREREFHIGNENFSFPLSVNVVRSLYLLYLFSFPIRKFFRDQKSGDENL